MGVKIRRLIAIYIDCNIIFWVSYYFCVFWSLFCKNIFFLFFLFFVGLLVFINIFLRKDVIFGYESIGKKLLRLKIYDENNNRLKDKKLLIDRVYHSLWTFNIYMFMILLNNKSAGDKKIKTTIR